MATKIVNCSSAVKFIPSVQFIMKHCRAFSSAADVLDVHIHDPANDSTKTQTVWPDHLLGPLGPQDKRFPMPGRVGPCVNSKLLNDLMNRSKEASSPPPPVFDPDNVLPKLPTDHHIDIAEQFLTSLDEMDLNCVDRGVAFLGLSDIIEYRAFSCPQLLRKEFKELFPDRNIMEDDLTVVTICVNTENDMSVTSSDVEQEREELLEMFIQRAVGICQAYEDSGHWADFVDPSSGKPFKGRHINVTMYGTDDRYRKLGFEILDRGTCKVISHPVWGTHAYVGSLFTSAPLNHPLTINLINN